MGRHRFLYFHLLLSNQGGYYGKSYSSGYKRPSLNQSKFSIHAATLGARKVSCYNGILQCFTCHSERDSSKVGAPPIEGKKGGGAILWKKDKYRIVAPNISPDPQAGAGTWTDDMFARAIREGVGHDGRVLVMMFWMSFRNLSDEDLASVIVYIRALPPVKNQLPRRSLSMEEEKSMQPNSLPLYEKVAHPDLSDQLTRGRYLVKLGDCAPCHTGWYKRNPGKFGGGNDLYGNFYRNHTKRKVFSSNITPDETGLGSWTKSAFITAIRTGKAGTLDPVMPWVAFRNMLDEDLKAILAALQKVPPVQHRIINGIQPTYCEVCRESHGYGKYNKIIPLQAFKQNSSSYLDYAGTYLNKEGFPIEIKVQGNNLLISEEGGPDLELVSIAENRFHASGLSTPISFKRGASGKVRWLISYGIEEESFERKVTP